MHATFLEKPTPQTLRGQIAERLRQSILNGTLHEGERLVERKLAEQFGASLTAVREAVIEMETDGLIVKRPNSTTAVVKLSPSDTDKIFTVRGILEKHAVEEAARKISPEEFKTIKAGYYVLIETARQGKAQEFVEKDFAWHASIWKIVGNEYLSGALRRCVVPIFALSAVHVGSREPAELVRDAESHRPLLEALRANDPRAAKRALAEALKDWKANTHNYIFGRERK
ncbi:MAG: GntR family transcriptional regulator [Acidobacteriota bacterium]|nr:GntR family transcriptional regulator [Acidobacteriota bacterium]